jgi:hypothetical protein
MKTTTRLRAARRGALAFAAAGILATTVGVGTASAASSSTLLYSTDGGASWSASVTADPGQTVLVRQWFDNDGAAAETSASVESTIPAGFTLQGGSTEVCLNPSTTDPTAPDASEERCTSANEAAAWTGSDLRLSPSAGHYGESASTTVGELPFGRKRYLNLQQCQTNTGTRWNTQIVPSQGAMTEVSNTARTTNQCPSAVSDTASGFLALDLLGNRYLNLHQCSYFQTGDGWVEGVTPNAWAGTGLDAYSNTSNTAAVAQSCGPNGAGYSLSAPRSGFAALDIRNARYVNLMNCQYYAPTPENFFWGAFTPNSQNGTALDGNPSASNVAATAPDCGAVASGYQTWNTTGFVALDLLDLNRGRGYVSYALTAPAAPSAATCASTGNAPGTEAFEQEASLQTASATTESSGDLAVDWSQLADPCNTAGIPLAHPGVVAAGLVALAGAGFALHRRQGDQVA